MESHTFPSSNILDHTSDSLHSASSYKRPTLDHDDSPAKRIRPPQEEPLIYSENVRKKLSATSRTGQACDRCKERKMKCDTNPIACQPCRQKNLRCFATDRVTGQSRERGQTDRVENEIMYLREQLATYQRKYGLTQSGDASMIPVTSASEQLPSAQPAVPSLPPERDRHSLSGLSTIPSARYVGWPAPNHSEPLHSGPVDGTTVNILDGGIIDIADFDCQMMNDYPPDNTDHFNVSKTSITSTICGRQKISDPELPSKEEALREVNNFLLVMFQYVPVVHKSSFIGLVHRMYDQPSTITTAQRCQIIVVLAILSHQTALRNHITAAAKLDQSYRYLHYALSSHNELLRDRSLASMQAMSLILIHFRNLPKPGCTWSYGHHLLVRAIDLDYHRDPDKIKVPPEENSPLDKELRKRVFHTILGICITTGCRVGRPAPWQFQHIDLPLPMPLKDSEISENGVVQSLSGSCDFWPHLHLAKLLPLLTELYNNVISVRRSESDYLRAVDALNTKINAWRQDWDDSISKEKPQISLSVATLLVETWAAEYTLNLHHPSLCTATSPEVIEKHLDICHKSAKRLLSAFHILSKSYKGVDFTWHSTVAYAMGFGLTIHVYRRRKGPVTQEQFESIKNELNGWLSLVAYADLILRTNNHLQKIFQPLVKGVEDDYRQLVTTSPNSVAPPRSSFSHINGNTSKPQIKTELLTQSPHGQIMPLSSHSQHASPGDLSLAAYNNNNPMTSHLPPNLTPSQHHQPPPPQWPSNMHQHFLSQSTNYNPSSPQYQQQPPLPVSLAPLLNESPQGTYMNYPASALPTTLGPHPDMMVFSPLHYSEDTPAAMWPNVSGGRF